MPREQIAMSAEEVTAFLREQRWMALGTLEAKGAPTGDVVPVVLDGASLCFGVERDGRSHRNICRDPRVCCSVDRYPSYYEIKGVTVHGRAEAVNDARVLDRLTAALGEGAPRRAFYALPLDDVASFDFAKIRNQY